MDALSWAGRDAGASETESGHAMDGHRATASDNVLTLRTHSRPHPSRHAAPWPGRRDRRSPCGRCFSGQTVACDGRHVVSP